MSPPADDGPPNPDRSRGRRLAEWVSMGVSALIVGGIALYLAYQTVAVSDEEFVRIEIQPRYEQVRLEDGRYILPVEVTNLGPRTVRDFTGQLRYPGPAGEPQTREITIDYLGEQARQTLYFYFDQPPRDLAIEARPLRYSLE